MPDKYVKDVIFALFIYRVFGSQHIYTRHLLGTSINILLCPTGAGCD